MAKQLDLYSNVYNFTISESAPNTLTFQEVRVGLNIFDKVGLVIHRITLGLGAAIPFMSADSDRIDFALTQSDQLTVLSFIEKSLIDRWSLRQLDFGTPANGIHESLEGYMNYENLPGGGLLVTPSPLFVAVHSSSISSAITIAGRIYFTVKKLAPSDYFELLESRHFFG